MTEKKSMFIERFRFGKGTEVNGKREYLELECRMPEGSTDKDFSSEFLAAEYIIDNLLAPVEGCQKTTPTSATPAGQAEPKLLMSMEELEKEPWKASAWVRKDDKLDRKARPGEDAFLPRMVADQRLLKMINEAVNNKLNLYNPPYESITFSGADGGLIARKGQQKKR